MGIFCKTKNVKNKNKLEKHEFFHMSFRFDKTKPEDFGLIGTEQEDIFVDPKDNSKWKKRHLIDMGWGLEVAFCKLPLLSFDELLQLSVYANPKEKSADLYCAIGILLKDYPYELLYFTEKILADKKDSLVNHKEFYHIVRTQMCYDDKILQNRWQILFDQTKELI